MVCGEWTEKGGGERESWERCLRTGGEERGMGLTTTGANVEMEEENVIWGAMGAI
jgi:hypothetical protein